MITRSKMGDYKKLKSLLEEIKLDLQKKATNERIDGLLKKIDEKI